MFGVRIRVAKKVSKRNGGEGVVVGGNELEEFHIGIDTRMVRSCYYNCWWRGLCSDNHRLAVSHSPLGIVQGMYPINGVGGSVMEQYNGDEWKGGDDGESSNLNEVVLMPSVEDGKKGLLGRPSPIGASVTLTWFVGLS